MAVGSLFSVFNNEPKFAHSSEKSFYLPINDRNKPVNGLISGSDYEANLVW